MAGCKAQWRQKNKGMFRKGETLRVVCSQKGLAVSQYVNVKINGFSSFFEIVEISKL
jgi:hypothetical protein